MNATAPSVPLSLSAALPDSAADAPNGAPEPFSPPPCFYWKLCAQRAALNKCGRSVCRRCADTLRGTEYPLRDPSLERLELMRDAALQRG